MSAVNLISFLLVASLLVSASLADLTKGISESVTEDSFEDEAARKAFLLKTNVIYLCKNLAGCTCDGKLEKANCSGMMKDRQVKEISFINVTIPKSIVKMEIVDYSFVEIAQTELADLVIKSLIIARVNRLHIGPGSLKQVDVLKLENIGELEYDKDAQTKLEADTVTFINVTFPIRAELVLLSIKSELKLVRCNLTDVKLIVDSSPQTDQSVSIDHSSLDRLSLKINTGTFTMNNNQFVRLASKSAGLMDIQYSHSLNLTNNQFGIRNAISVLPDVMSSNESLKFHVINNLSVENKEWLEHFKLEFIGRTSTGATSQGNTSCNVQNVNAHHANAPDSTNNRVLICPNIKSLGEFLKMETKSTMHVIKPTTHGSHHQPEKQIKIQTHDNVKALGVSTLHHNLPILVGLILITCEKVLIYI